MSNTLTKFGVSGKMGSGKSTVARLAAARLSSATGVEWKVKAFAGPLKTLVCKIYNVPVCLAYTDIGKKVVPHEIYTATRADLPIPISDLDLELLNVFAMEAYRSKATLGVLFQKFGQLLRNIDPDYWVRAFEKEIGPNDRIVIEDVRYPNEFNWIRNNGGIVCRVFADSATTADGRSTTHESETALDCVMADITLDNSVRGPDMSGLHNDLAAQLSAYSWAR